MRTKLLSLCLVLLMGVSAWADNVWNYNIYDDCSKNGYKGGYVPAPADVQAVDLGLPSGIKWATCNVGAEKPEDYGNYYAWGEVLPKDYYDFGTYKYANGASDELTKYCNNASYGDNGFTDNKTTLEPEDDAAHVNWGGSWRMPTDAEWQELRDNCTWTWTTQNGINGYQVTSQKNSNSIFSSRCGLSQRHGSQRCRRLRQLLVFVAQRELPVPRVVPLLRSGRRGQELLLSLQRSIRAPCLPVAVESSHTGKEHATHAKKFLSVARLWSKLTGAIGRNFLRT